MVNFFIRSTFTLFSQVLAESSTFIGRCFSYLVRPSSVAIGDGSYLPEGSRPIGSHPKPSQLIQSHPIISIPVCTKFCTVRDMRMSPLILALRKYLRYPFTSGYGTK